MQAVESMSRAEAFQIFRRNYKQMEEFELKKIQLKQKYRDAKDLGKLINQIRDNVNILKSRLQQYQMTKAVQNLSKPSMPATGANARENQIREEMEQERLKYQTAFEKLRTQKAEIDHLQHQLQKVRISMQQDFERWLNEKTREVQKPPQPATQQGKELSAHVSSSKSKSYSDNSVSSESPPSEEQSPPKAEVHVQLAALSLTGDSQTDADILAFMKARHKVLQGVHTRYA